MKYIKSLILLASTFFICGYTNYFVSDDTAVEKLYGRNKMQNFVAAKTTVYNLQNQDFCCKGMYFLTQPSTDSTKKNEPGIPFARIKCTDDRIIELKWNKDDTVSGLDQYNKTYKFKQVKKKDFKKYVKNENKL